MTVRRRVSLTRPELRILDAAAAALETSSPLAVLDADQARQLKRAREKLGDALQHIEGTKP